MQYIKPEGDSHPIKAWTGDMAIEGTAMKQLENVASLPFIFKHVAVMPDVHGGYGSCVGAVIPTKGAVVPAAVGSDAGCGMIATPLNLRVDDVPESIRPCIRAAIEQRVPVGRSNNGGLGDIGAHQRLPDDAQNVYRDSLQPELQEILVTHPRLVRHGSAEDRAQSQLGTLGTGNHFIELCVDESDNVWTMLHSGSRGIGAAIGNFFSKVAKDLCEQWFVSLPSPDLAYIPQREAAFSQYLRAAHWAQKYALANRKLMAYWVCQAIGDALGGKVETVGESVACHHNYIAEEKHFGERVWITRKGAVSARQGQLGIIPGAMGRASFIVRGKGCRESFTSCSHGAGRLMSRTAARKHFTVLDHRRDTEGLECRKDASVLDETPGAYKPIERVMAAQDDLIEIVHQLRALICVKG